jgi:hypothetical protein
MKRAVLVGLFSAVIATAPAFYPRQAMAASIDAIAVDDDVKTGAGDAGWGTGEGDTEKEAKDMALKNCAKNGNKSCQIVLTYKQCAAYASSRKHFGTGTGPSKDVARAKAMEDCGNDNCKVVVSDCVGD